MKLEERIRELVEKCDYVGIDQVRDYLKGENVSFSGQTIKEYLYRLQKEGVVQDAGRGWYTTIGKKFKLDTSAIDGLVETLDEKFPFLEFCVWSTRQIASYYQHMLGKFHYFIYTEKNTEKSVYDFLIGENKNVYQNPRKPDQKHFETTKETYIVRPSISKQPCIEHCAPIEKILVDLYVEQRELNLTSRQEFKRVFENITGQYRIEASKLLSYAVTSHDNPV
jgi:hypothetical protein